MVLADHNAPIVLDLPTGEAQVALDGINTQVGANSYGDVQPVPLASGQTMLVNRQNGTFNLLEPDNFVLDRTGGGVSLGPLKGSNGATGLADGNSTFIVRYAPKSTVALVDASTVQQVASQDQLTSASSAPPTPNVTPLGYAELPGSVPSSAGAETVVGGVLYSAVDTGSHRILSALSPRRGGTTAMSQRTVTDLGKAGTPTALQAAPKAAGKSAPKEKSPPALLDASAGSVKLIDSGGHARTVRSPKTAGATDILPAGNTAGKAWWLVHDPAGWSLLGADTNGHVTGPTPIKVPKTASLTPPVAAGGSLYLSQQEPTGVPSLWQLDVKTTHLSTLPGVPTYPKLKPSESADFSDNYVTGGTPGQVIFDNPDSILGVVVFASAKPRVVTFNKADGLIVSAIGADIAGNNPGGNGPGGSGPGGNGPGQNPQPVPTGPPAPSPALPPAVPTLSPQSCAGTTQTPNVPSISQVTPAAETALVTWSYPLLSPQDCEPTSWAINVQALNGAPQPANPMQTESGQNQYTLTGLRPRTAYQVTVTAYIGQRSTPSGASQFGTKDEGANPPTNVHTVYNNGSWVVSWTPCTDSSCVSPAASWTITGAACGGSVVPQPPNTTANGPQTSVSIPADGNLGNSLSFSVQGVTGSGTPGTPASDHACTLAPNPAPTTTAPPPSAPPPPAPIPPPRTDAVTLSAQPGPDGTSTQLAVNPPTPDPAIYGTNQPNFTYTVQGVGNQNTNSFTTNFGNLKPGTQYQATVTWLAGGYGQQTKQTTFTTSPPPPPPAPPPRNNPWPGQISILNATLKISNGNNPNVGDVDVALAGIPDGVSLNATPNFSNCGTEPNVGPQHVNDNGIGTGSVDFGNISLTTFGGQDCGVTLTFSTEGNDPYSTGPNQQYSQINSQVPPVTAANFVAAYNGATPNGQNQIRVTETGGGGLYGWQIVNDPGCNPKNLGANGRNPWELVLPPKCPSSTVTHPEIQVDVQYAAANGQQSPVTLFIGGAPAIPPPPPPPLPPAPPRPAAAIQGRGPLGGARLDTATVVRRSPAPGTIANGDSSPWVLALAAAGTVAAFRLRRRRRTTTKQKPPTKGRH